MALFDFESVVGVPGQSGVRGPSEGAALRVGCEHFDVLEVIAWPFLQGDRDRLHRSGLAYGAAKKSWAAYSFRIATPLERSRLADLQRGRPVCEFYRRD